MARLCRRLAEAGLGAVRVSVGERLSYPDERITTGSAAELAAGRYHPLSVALIENAAAVTLESVAELNACRDAFPFTETEAVCLTVARDRKAGRYHLMSAQNPIYLFTFQQKEPCS